MNYYDHLKKILIYFVIVVGILYTFFHGKVIKSNTIKGRGYILTFPPGWIKDEQNSTKEKFGRHEEEPEFVIFKCPQTYPHTEIPLAIISMYDIKLTQATWITDEFPNILNQLQASGYTLVDKGEIKIDKLICKWVLYEDPISPRLNLEFYTVDDSNMLYKLQYSTYPDVFANYRQVFEATRSSLKFTKLTIE